MISREKLAHFASNAEAKQEPESGRTAFDMERFISEHGFVVISRKPWQAHPGGLIFELDQCPFNPDHQKGSTAFTLVDGVPGFSCKHNGCAGRTIKDVFAAYPAAAYTEQAEPNQAQILIGLCAEVGLFHTPQGDAYARVPNGQHYETWALRSRRFSSLLLREFHR